MNDKTSESATPPLSVKAKSLIERLHRSIADGHWNDFLQCLEKGADANIAIDSSVSFYPKNALLIAAEYRRFEMIKHLIDQAKVDLQSRDYFGKNALQSLLIHKPKNTTIEPKSDFYRAAKYLIEQGIDVSISTTGRGDHYGLSPLHWAIKEGEGALLDLFLELGADLNVKSVEHKSAMHYYAYSSLDASFVPKFAGAGADLNSKMPEGWIALQIAASAGRLEMVKALVEAGADIHLSDDNGVNALEDAISYGHYQVAQYLYDQGCHALALGPKQETAIHRMFENEVFKKKSLEWMLKLGVPINHQNDEGLSALHYAINYDCYDGSIDLMKAGIDVNLQDRFGDSALFYALRNYVAREDEHILCLLEHEADLELTNYSQESVFDVLNSCTQPNMSIHQHIKGAALAQKEKKTLEGVITKPQADLTDQVEEPMDGLQAITPSTKQKQRL